MTWRDDIVAALKALGGEGSLEEIYAKLPPSRKRVSNYQSTVRNCLQLHCAASDHFTGTAAFARKGWGKWSLHKTARKPRKGKSTAKPKTKAKKKR